MFRGRRQIFWFIIGGFLLLLAGIVAIAGITFPYSLPIVLVVAGIIIIVAGLLGFTPAFPAFIVFLAGIVALGWAASAGFSAFTTTETRELTVAEVPPTVEEIELSCTVSIGTIKVSFTSNQTSLYRIVFTKYYSFFVQPTVNFSYKVQNEKLIITASSTTVAVAITLGQNLRSRLNLTTTTGSIRVEVPTTMSKVEKMSLTTTTGEVWVNATNTARLQNLVARTTTGRVEAYIKSSFQSRDATVQLSTTTGKVKLDLNITNIESDVRALTTTGRVNLESVSDFSILSQTQTNLQAQTPNYGLSGLRKLDISANTTTGNVDLSLYHK